MTSTRITDLAVVKHKDCLYRWNDIIIHTCGGHSRDVVEHECPCGAIRIPTPQARTTGTGEDNS